MSVQEAQCLTLKVVVRIVVAVKGTLELSCAQSALVDILLGMARKFFIGPFSAFSHDTIKGSFFQTLPMSLPKSLPPFLHLAGDAVSSPSLSLQKSGLQVGDHINSLPSQLKMHLFLGLHFPLPAQLKGKMGSLTLTQTPYLGPSQDSSTGYRPYTLWPGQEGALLAVPFCTEQGVWRQGRESTWPQGPALRMCSRY